jgi:hypothetical protein
MEFSVLVGLHIVYFPGDDIEKVETCRTNISDKLLLLIVKVVGSKTV